MAELHWEDAGELARALDSGEVSAVEIAEALVERTERVEGILHAYLCRTHERALEEAAAADGRRATGEARSRFDGVPLGYNDIFATRGVPTTCGARIL